MNRIADSFSWPFRGRRLAVWVPGLIAVFFLPVGFVPVLGYAVAAVRAADAEPPPWRIGQVLVAGAWVALAVALLTAPFVLLGIPLSTALHSSALWRSSGTLLNVEAVTTAALILALPWGIVLLLLMPHATARYAASGRVVDLFNFASSLRSVRDDFPAWNVAVAAIVTAWAIGLACSALFCVGVVPGVFYAILVSAHATATLRSQGEDQSAR